MVSILEPDVVSAALEVPAAWKLIAYLCVGYSDGENEMPELQRAGWETRDGTIMFLDDVYKHDEALDRDALADAAAGGFVAPVRREVKQSSNLDSR